MKLIAGNYKRTLLKNFLFLVQLAANPGRNKIFIFFLLNFCNPSFSYFFIKELTKPNKFREKLTNTSPLFFLPIRTKESILEKKKESLPSYYNYLIKFILTFYEKFFNLKTLIKIKFFKKTYNFIEDRLQRSYFFKKYWKFQRRIGKGFFFLEALKVVWFTLLIKDCRFFLNWFRRTMERVYFKNQKKLLRFLKFLFRSTFKYFYKSLNTKGFFFDIRGKVGVTGNAKKRHFFFKEGLCSFSRKKLRLVFHQDLVRTKTGVLGVTFAIAH